MLTLCRHPWVLTCKVLSQLPFLQKSLLISVTLQPCSFPSPWQAWPLKFLSAQPTFAHTPFCSSLISSPCSFCEAIIHLCQHAEHAAADTEILAVCTKGERLGWITPRVWVISSLAVAQWAVLSHTVMDGSYGSLPPLWKWMYNACQLLYCTLQNSIVSDLCSQQTNHTNNAATAQQLYSQAFLPQRQTDTRSPSAIKWCCIIQRGIFYGQRVYDTQNLPWVQ